MPLKNDSDPGINSWLEDELYQQYLHDRGAVDESWKRVFERALAPSPPRKPPRRPARRSSLCAASRPRSPRI
jgi:2-oxoglutarate dehydrogenase complex dehydrogenase (E1) component-like enzyme